MGPTTLAAPAPSLHRAWWWLNAFAKMEALQIPEKVPLPKTGTEHGLSRKVYGRFKKTNPCAPTYRQKGLPKKVGGFCQAAFCFPKTVVEYLGRYSHKTAISNHRLVQVNENGVAFTYKDYRDVGKKKLAHLSGAEFLRRFACHIFPPGFMRIRHYGFLASRNKKTELNLAKKALKQPQWSPEKRPWQQIAREKLNFNPDKCPHCHSESLAIIKVINPERGPPRWPAMMAGNKAL
jgi:hypothetical protein